VDGDTIRRNLEEYRGKLLVLDFWASWCAICLHHMKGDRDLWKKYQKNTSVLRVNPHSTKDKFQAIQKVNRLHFKEGFNSVFSDLYLSKIFPVYAYPTYIMIDSQGNYIAGVTSIAEGHINHSLRRK